ncbi:hypothetical protein [Kocuria sp. CH-021]|uniref:ORC-CDC6 family AAA ATPase n=1 Tax=Kocuria sp. CH-021 TaxID=3406735 RepID=UPI003C7570D9
MNTETLLAALQEVEKRAERVSEQDVIATYVGVDSLVNALKTRDNGIVYGRRGTGKTHALKYLAEIERAKGNSVVYIDMEQDVGSTEGRYADTNLSLSERATRLVVDVLSIVHTRLLEDAFSGKADTQIEILDRMLDHFDQVVVVEETEEERISGREDKGGANASVGIKANLAGLSGDAKLGGNNESKVSDSQRVRVTGKPRYRIHFGGVTQSMKQAIQASSASRFWVLIDEWSGIPLDLQPYLAEMLRRLFFGIPKVTVRIGAIPHRTEWRIAGERGSYIGAEIGAEIFPLLDLDEFVVFPARNREEQAERSLSFFRSLLHRHVSQALTSIGVNESVSPAELVSLLFTQVTALQEVIRAAEGVPRDALNIVGRAGLRAGGSKIAVTHVREAAAQLYTTTKAAQLNGVPSARMLLDRIVQDVISGRKARAFLLAQEQTNHPLIQQLVDDRILHIIKRGYSSKDDPGERFDVLQIDYGCYVHLLGTTAAPQRFLGEAEDDTAFSALVGAVEVPEDDYRAIRRAVLNLPTMLRGLPQ